MELTLLWQGQALRPSLLKLGALATVGEGVAMEPTREVLTVVMERVPIRALAVDSRLKPSS